MEMIKNRKINFNTKDEIKNFHNFKKWLPNFENVELDDDYFDNTLHDIIFLLHNNDLVRSLYEDVIGQNYYSGCDQYSIALSLVLIYKGWNNVLMLRSYEVDEQEYDKGLIRKASPTEKYAHLGYIPHNFVQVKLNNNLKYITNPKYMRIVNGLLYSDISSEYHSLFDKTYMIKKHQDSSIKSLIYSNLITQNIENNEEFDFPIYIKDKKGKRKVYKIYEITTFEKWKI